MELEVSFSVQVPSDYKVRVRLTGIGGLVIAQAEIEADLRKQVARAAGMASRSAANTDDVVSLRIEIEERVEGGRAVDSCRRNTGLVGNVAQRGHGKKLVGVGGLDGFKDSEERSGRSRNFPITWSIRSFSWGSRTSVATSLAAAGMNPPHLQFRTGSDERGKKGKELRQQRLVCLAKEDDASAGADEFRAHFSPENVRAELGTCESSTGCASGHRRL